MSRELPASSFKKEMYFETQICPPKLKKNYKMQLELDSISAKI